MGKICIYYLTCKIMWGRFKLHNLYPDKHAAMMKMNVDVEKICKSLWRSCFFREPAGYREVIESI